MRVAIALADRAEVLCLVKPMLVNTGRVNLLLGGTVVREWRRSLGAGIKPAGVSGAIETGLRCRATGAGRHERCATAIGNCGWSARSHAMRVSWPSGMHRCDGNGSNAC